VLRASFHWRSTPFGDERWNIVSGNFPLKSTELGCVKTSLYSSIRSQCSSDITMISVTGIIVASIRPRRTISKLDRNGSGMQDRILEIEPFDSIVLSLCLSPHSALSSLAKHRYL